MQFLWKEKAKQKRQYVSIFIIAFYFLRPLLFNKSLYFSEVSILFINGHEQNYQRLTVYLTSHSSLELSGSNTRRNFPLYRNDGIVGKKLNQARVF